MLKQGGVLEENPENPVAFFGDGNHDSPLPETTQIVGIL
jgi:hypothetical protein